MNRLRQARSLRNFGVDALQIFAHQPDGGGTHTFEFRMLLQDQKQFEQCKRRALEYVAACHFQKITVRLEAPVERSNLGFAVVAEWLPGSAATGFR